jgi:hypothetical protein
MFAYNFAKNLRKASYYRIDTYPNLQPNGHGIDRPFG